MVTGRLVGRGAEVADVEARCATSRLVTVIGPGGVGKTALVRAVADRVGGRFASGVRSVDLTRLDDEAVVPGTIANQLGFDSFDALLSSPNDRPVLLVVDNCEHLLDAVAAALVQVLGSCHQPAVLATSRSPLEVPGESVVSLAPLPVPGEDVDPTTCASVQLFLERAREAGAQVGDADLPVVADLCRRLDGLPLAIEIAAARARTMSVAEITSRLSDGVDVLHRPRFRGDPRHRSVAETIRWSYDLLGEPQANLLEQLAVFAGPFSRASAEAVAGTGHPDVPGELDDLVNASLVAVDTDGPITRYRLLDTVRRFALEQLDRGEGRAATYDRFVDHVVRSVREIVEGSAAVWRPGVIGELIAAFDDIGEALTWCLAEDATPRRAYALCSVLWGITHQGRADDIAELTRRTLARWPADGSPASAQVVAVRATAEYVTGHPARAIELARPALAALPGPGPSSVTLSRVLGQAMRATGDLEGSIAAFRAGAAIGGDLGMAAMALELETAAAIVAADQGEVDPAMLELRGIIDRAVSIDSVLTVAWARTALAWIALRREPPAALPLIDAALAEARRIDYPVAIAVGLRSRAYAELLTGRDAAAVGTATELMRDLLARGALSNGRLLLDVTAAIAHQNRHAAWEQLAATARSLPITTLASAHFELVALPATDVPPVPRHDSIAAAWTVLAELSTTVGRPGDEPAVASSAEGTVRHLGDVCEFTFAGSSVSLRAAKGVDDLLRLIEADGREIHCLDLIGAGVEEPSTGEVIDATARRSYEERIRELQAEIDEATANSDFARAYQHEAQLDALVEHLTAALGQGNRTRREAGTAERARSAVTHRVRTTIRNLGRGHPLLGRHLSHAVNTGTYCSYRPEQPTRWTID